MCLRTILDDVEPTFFAKRIGTNIRGKVKHELQVTSYEFKSTHCEFKSTSYEFKSTSYEFKSTGSRII